MRIVNNFFNPFFPNVKWLVKWVRLCFNAAVLASKIFRNFLKKNKIKGKSIIVRYPQLQGNIEDYHKIVNKE